MIENGFENGFHLFTRISEDKNHKRVVEKERKHERECNSAHEDLTPYAT